MARKTENDGELRECPVCETPLDKAVNLGLRDFNWVNEELPGKIGLMDLDGVLSQASTGRMLVLELKPKGALVSRGARIAFGTLVKSGFDVWIVWDLGKGRVKLGECNDKGWPQNVRELTRKRAAKLVVNWWLEGVK